MAPLQKNEAVHESQSIKILQDDELNCHLTMCLVSAVKYQSQMLQDILIIKKIRRDSLKLNKDWIQT